LLDRIEKGPALDDPQRAWLIEELEADLSDQIEDIRETGKAPAELGAREMVETRGVIRWLRDGLDPGPAASRFLEKHEELYRPVQGDSDLAALAAYAAAIADLRDGDVVPSAAPPRRGDPEQRRRILDFQGRKIRALIEDRGLTIARLADLSGVDIVELVAILYGLTDMALRDWELLSAALEVDLDAAFVGIRFVPAAGPDGRSIVLIEGEDEPTDGDGSSPDPSGRDRR
jgi:transcriptional regulator with XRE-family HTH domain